MTRSNKSTRSILSTTAIATLAATTTLARAEPTASDATDRTPVTVGFVYPLATNANRPDVTTNTDLSVLYGRVGAVEGLQLGGVAVLSSRGVTGAQIGGLTGIALGGVHGAQLGGAFNLSQGTTTGLQLSGAANVTTDDVKGAQISTVNVAGPVDGVQIGVVNVGRKVKGLQLGLVNVADDVDGAAIGLVSISKDSVHPLVWTSNLEYMNVGVKFSSKYVYTLFGVYYGNHESDFDHVGATTALGGHIPLPARFDIEVQGALTLIGPVTHPSEKKENSFIAPQVIGGYSFAPHLRVFAGAGVRMPISVHVGRDVSRPEVLAGIQF